MSAETPSEHGDEPDQGVRLDRLMAQRGLCSRREAARLVRGGAVRVEGRPITEPGRRLPAACRIECASGRPHRATVLLHKPTGVDSASAATLITAERCAGDPRDRLQAGALQERAHLAVAGRLDAASSGLLVLTADGRVARALTAGGSMAKTYRVTLAEPVSSRLVDRLRSIDRLDDAPLRPMQVTRSGERQLRFVLHQGRKHQIRRCCLQVGLRVERLHRVGIGPWSVEDLDAGAWRAVAAPTALG